MKMVGRPGHLGIPRSKMETQKQQRNCFKLLKEKKINLEFKFINKCDSRKKN